MSTINLPAEGLRDHLVIVGFGRVGRYVAHVLQRLEVPFVVIEHDHQLVEQGRAMGVALIFGDATQEIVLEAARIQHSHLLLITVPVISATLGIVRTTRRLCPDLHIVARASHEEELHMLQELGIYEVVQPEFEAGLEITRQALLHLSIPASDIQRFVDTIRRELYAPLYEQHDDYEEIARLQAAQHLMQLTWVRLEPGSQLAERTVAECDVRRRTGASVVALLREGRLHPNPDPGSRLQVGDYIAVLGNEAELAAFQEQMAGPR